MTYKKDWSTYKEKKWQSYCIQAAAYILQLNTNNNS